MTTNTEKIKRTFSIFHDGTICEFDSNSDYVRIKVDCYYLSKRIDPEYESFFVDIFNPTEFEFEPWSIKGQSQKTVSDFNLIAQYEYNIFACIYEHNTFQIDSEIENPKTSLIGGSLNFDCNGIKIYDQSLDEMTFEQLSDLSKEYWTEFKGQTD